MVTLTTDAAGGHRHDSSTAEELSALAERWVTDGTKISLLLQGRVRLLGYAGSMAGRTYADNRPYLLPDALGELTGPVSGVVQLPLRLDWSERVAFHLDDPAERNVMYERVIREATQVDDLRSYLNEAILRRVWRRLFLPQSVRRSWEQRFPDLRLAA
jgi:hypothetical protein